MPVGSNQMKSALHQAVFRFDTRIVISCEEFAGEMAGRALVNMTMHIEAQWERIRADSRVHRSSGPASPECLVQAGMMVL
jgi:phage baseplate assembly protein W